MADANARFQRCEALILKWEGGFTQNPKDPGGATNMGVTKRALEEWRGHAVTVDDVRNLKADEVAAIYRQKYWPPADSLPAGIDLMYFNAAVNCGRGRAARFLQSACRLSNVDGIIGPQTLAAANRGAPCDIIDLFADAQEDFYRSLSTFPTFGKGWMARLDKCHEIAHGWAA